MKTSLTLLTLFLISSHAFCQDAPPEANAMEQRRAELLKRFPQLDTNQDGILTAQEIAAQREQRTSGPEAERRLQLLLKRIPQADTNKDGKLTFEEFRAFRVANPDAMPANNRRQRPPKVEAPVPDVAYGDHDQQKFDLWPVEGASEPTPLVLFIHGGGFRGGDKSLVKEATIKQYQEAGIAYASLNYRLSSNGPYPIMMHDAARGLQTIRHRAKEWNIDPEKIVCYGGSAGAGISLWLAFHDDMADADSEDPIARQSTRILAAGTMNGQSAYDIHLFREWFGVPDLQAGPALPAFVGVEDPADMDLPEIRAVMKDASPITHFGEEDDADVYMFYSRPNSTVTAETHHSITVHHVLLGLKLQEAMQALGKECVVVAPDLQPENSPYESLEDFLIQKLTAE